MQRVRNMNKLFIVFMQAQEVPDQKYIENLQQKGDIKNYHKYVDNVQLTVPDQKS